MKKFLTVLLVIAVMFTFSFGSAFAAAPTDAEAFATAVNAYKSAKTYDGSGYLYADVETSPGWDGIVSKAIFEAAIDAWADNVDLTTVDYVSSGALTSDAKTAMLTAIKTDVEAAQYDVELGKLNDLIASIDLSAYNKTGKTNLQSAIEAAEDAIAALSGKNVTTIAAIKDEVTTLKGAIDTNKVNLLSKASETLAKDVAALEKTLDEASDNYYVFAKEWFAANAVTAANEVAAKASFDADFNALVSYFAECIDRYEGEVADDETPFVTAERLGQVIGYFFATNEAVNSPADTIDGYFQVAKQNLAQKNVWVSYYEKAAATAKETLNADGTKKYYDADIDILLADTKDAVEDDLWTMMNSSSWGTAAAAEWANLATLANKNYDLQGYRAAAIAKFTEGNYAPANWVGARKTKVKAIQKEYSEKVLLAESVSEIDALVKEAKTAINAIMNKDDVDSVAAKVASRIKAASYLSTCTTSTDGYGDVETAADGGFSSYFDVVVGPASTYKNSIKADALKAAAQVFVDAVLAEENDSITYKQIDEIIAANKEAAYAALKDVKTTSELKAEAAAVADLIKVLPTTVTIADKDQVLAAQAAMDAYVENAGAAQTDVAKYTTLKTALTTIINAEAKEVNKLLRALPLNVTVADADQIAAARDAFDAFYDAYGDYEDTDFTTASFPAETRLETAEAALETAKLENAAKLIEALTATSSKEEIEAAKAAFDGLKTETKLTLNNQLYNKLMTAVESIGANAEENAKAYVQDMKIAARSAKTSKGVKITIKADVQQLLDDGFTVEYRFYRSTKSNKNFGKPMIVKSTNTYTNTKGVKGTRYYYKAKIVVKNAAGEVVATTPLTQCLYATRVF